jgi:cytochrome d ubiquinol oxidase subunit II
VTLDSAPLVVLLVGLVAYAVLGGADFGAGFWQMIPGSDGRRRAVRDHARHAITPVWEANHVWLILVLTVCWTCYPAVYGSIASTLAVPLTIAGLGIVLRATGYVVRAQSPSRRIERPVELLFGVSSVIVPFAFGTVIGAIASGRVPVGNARGDLITSWLNPTSVAVGVIAVASAAYLAAVWLSADAARMRRNDLVESYRVLALVAAAAAGVAAVAGLVVVREDAEHLWHNLTRWPADAAVIASALAGAGAIRCLAARRLEPARLVSVVAVGAVIAGWALAQRPDLLPGVTVDEAAADRATLIAVLAGLAFGALILVPSLVVLFRMVLRGRFDPDTGADDRPGPPLPASLARQTRRATLICLAGIAAGGLILFLGDVSWSILLGAALLVALGAAAFVLVARSLVADGG